jgi:hypothetical protein
MPRPPVRNGQSNSPGRFGSPQVAGCGKPRKATGVGREVAAKASGRSSRTEKYSAEVALKV